MRVRCSVPFALLLFASAAGASPFHATLTLDFLGEQMHFVGSGNGYNTPAFVTLPGGTFTGTDFATFGPASTFDRITVSLVPGGPASFAGTPLAGPMPLRGVLRPKLAGTTPVVPLNSGYDLKAFGVGGSVDVTIWYDQTLTLFFEPWSAGMATVRESNAMYTGVDARTPDGRGKITLVSPAKLSFGAGGNNAVLLGTLEIDFVPEPGAPLLVATGAALLCVLGWRRGTGRN